MGNNIFNRQNDAIILKSLVSQRRLYSSAKCFSYAPWIISLILAVISFFWRVGECNMISWIVATISFVGWEAAIFGEKYGGLLRRKAARIQQFIDREIFKEAFTAEDLVSWCNVSLVSELSEENAKVSESDIKKEKVRNWYSDYSELNPLHAVFCCQRENLRWDKKLRVFVLLCVLFCLFFCGIVWCIKVWNLKVCEVLPVLVSGGGVVSILIKILVGLIFDLVRMGRISTVTDIVEATLRQGSDPAPLLITLQGLIYDNRCSVVLIPDFVYKMLQKKYQKNEDSIAKVYVETEDNGVALC